MIRFNLVALVSVISISCAASPALAISIDDFQNSLPAGQTYVDLTDVNTLNAGGWNWPDGSDSDFTIDGNVADDKSGDNVTEMDMTIDGLLPDSAYNIDVVIFAKAGEEDSFGFAGGFASGELTNYLASDGSDATPGGAVTGGNWRVPMGSALSDGAGALHVYLDNDAPGNKPRSEIDGVIYSLVPEPTSLTLLGIGSLMALGLRRRRTA